MEKLIAFANRLSKTARLFTAPVADGGLSTNSRSMPVNILTPGSNYTFQVRAIGGSTGCSDWSDPVWQMRM